MLDHTSTGFQPKNVDLNEMVDIDVKKVVIIGDGMSGKTQTLITFGKKILTYLQKIYSARSILEDRFSEDAGLEVALESFGDSYEVDPAFKSWAERYGFLLQYGNNKWNVTSVSLDTETIGFEDFHFIFPFVWNNKTYRINLVGSDVGGQNIFDHFRTVLGKIAGVNDILMVVFDKSRALSCWNSIDQVQKVVGDKISEQRLGQSNIPRIVYVGNKIDLEEHINKQEWQNSISNSIMKTFSQVADYRQGAYQLPSLVGKKGVERSFNFKIENNLLHFPDFEALIYNAIRETDPEYRTQKIMTDVNAKAIAREITAQFVFQRKVEESEGTKEANSIMTVLEAFGNLLFQRRPLAMQYSGGIEQIHETTSESNSFGRVRAKWIDFQVHFNSLTRTNVSFALESAANAKNLLTSDVGEFFNTNALLGTGIMALWDSIIREKLSKAIDFKEDKKSKKRRIRKF
jgi:GTPase SAR1 family protein